MAEYSQKWHNETSRGRSTETSDGLAVIQAQLNNLGREIKKSTMLGDLTTKGIALSATFSSSGMTSIRLLSSVVSLSSSTFCFLELSYSSSSPALFKLLLCPISASAFLELSSTSSVL
ncbi:hypothetical protein Tco_1013502 [Tanacetum coccineum]